MIENLQFLQTTRRKANAFTIASFLLDGKKIRMAIQYNVVTNEDKINWWELNGKPSKVQLLDAVQVEYIVCRFFSHIKKIGMLDKIKKTMGI